MTAGRPALYKTPEELQAKIEEYFNQAYFDEKGNRREKPLHIGVASMAHYLGFVSRQSILDYGKRDDFKWAIQRAKLQIEAALEERLDGPNVAGTIFNLINNFGWSNKQEIAHSGNLSTMTDDELDRRIKMLSEGLNDPRD